MREVFVTTPTKPHHRALLEQAAAGRCRLTFGTDGIERADAVIGAVEPEMLKKIPRLPGITWCWRGWIRCGKTCCPPAAA